jgi:integrase
MNTPDLSLVETTSTALDKCTRDGLTIFKRYPGPEQAYYHKFKYAGKQHMLKLATTAEDSFPIARKLRAAIKAGRLASVNQALDAFKERRASSTLAELFKRYEDKVRGITGIAAKTAKRNCNCIRQIFRHAIDVNLTNEAIDKLPTTDLNAALLEKYKSKLLAASGTNILAQDSAYVTANTAIRMARSLFCKKLPDDFYQGLVLPDTTALFKVKLFKETRKGFQMPASDTVDKIRAAAVELKKADPNAYIIYLLALGTGLRAGEIGRSRQHWIETIVNQTETQTIIRVQAETDFRPKAKQERTVPIDAFILAELNEMIIPVLPGTPDYIMRGHKTERCDQAFRRFSKWLEVLGWDREKKSA